MEPRDIIGIMKSPTPSIEELEFELRNAALEVSEENTRASVEEDPESKGWYAAVVLANDGTDFVVNTKGPYIWDNKEDALSSAEVMRSALIHEIMKMLLGSVDVK